MCAVESFAGRGSARVASSAISARMPGAAELVTPRPASSRGRAETDAALAREPLHVNDALQGDRVTAVFGVKCQGSLARARAELCGTEGLLERICGPRRDKGSHDLATVECDFDSYPLRFSHL